MSSPSENKTTEDPIKSSQTEQGPPSPAPLLPPSVKDAALKTISSAHPTPKADTDGSGGGVQCTSRGVKDRATAPPGGGGGSYNRLSRRARRKSFSADMGKKRSTSRSEAMMEDLMGGEGRALGGSDEERGAIPKWLVEQQAKHARDDGSGGDAAGTKARSKSGKKETLARKTNSGDDDVFVMVDLLDASHLPSTTSLPKTKAEDLLVEREQKRGVKPGRGGRRHMRGLSLNIEVDERSKDAHEVASRWRRNVEEPGMDKRGGEKVNRDDAKRNAENDTSQSTMIPASWNTALQSSVTEKRGDLDNGSISGEIDRHYDDAERKGFLGSFLLSVRQFFRGDSGDKLKFSEEAKLLQGPSKKDNGSLLTGDEIFKSSRKDDQFVYPSEWEWRRPADEDVLVPPGAWLYLALIGWLTFLFCYGVTVTSRTLIIFIRGFSSFIEQQLGWSVGLMILASFRVLFAISAFWLVRKISPRYSNGSGIPEMKCVLSGVYMPKALSGSTLMAKLMGLTFSLATGLSIGKLGPFVHISGMIAALISRRPWFANLHTSARCQLQAVSAAMAAGVGATFGAPIGATLLSIELMSTYYYIHWIPIALYCTVMGYLLVVAVFRFDELAYFYSSFEASFHKHEFQRVVAYSFLGIICGLLGALLVWYTTKMFTLRKTHVPEKSFRRGILLMTVFTLAHTLITSCCAGVLQKEQKAAVVYLFNHPGAHTELYTALPFVLPTKQMNSAVTLTIAIIIKFLLTGVSLILPIPAGTFIPIFEVGALVGRLYGDLVKLLFPVSWLDPRATAVVGAAAMTAGTLHITSIAVIMLELTMDAVNVLPLLFCVVIAYASSKYICSDLFSELIKLRKLPFILGLRERYPHETRRFYKAVSTVTASSFMSTDFPFVTPESTKGEVRRLLATGHWSACAFLSSKQDRKLLGTIPRSALAQAVAIPSAVPVARARDLEKGEGKQRRAEGSSASSTDYGSCVLDTFQALNDHELVPFLANFEAERGHRNVDMGPMIVGAHTPFWKVTTYFRMLGMSKMYVTKDGVCVGYLTKAHVIRSSFEIEEEARKKETARKDPRRRSGRSLSRRQSTANLANFDKICIRRNSSSR